MKRKTALLAGLIAGLLPVATAAALPAAASAKTNVLTLTMNGKSIRMSGKPTSGAVTVISKVTAKSGAAPTLVHLNPGASFRKAFRAAMSHHGDPNYIDPYGQIVFSPSASQGRSTAQTVLRPGRWVALDTMNSNPAKWPHTEFTVGKARKPGKLPKPAATVKTIEFGFTGPSTWQDGSVIRFENAGFLAHMIIGIQVRNSADAATVTKLLQEGKDNAAQALAIGFQAFVNTFSPGGIQQQTLTAAPGTWVLACFMDTQDGREHTRVGMERTITIAPPLAGHSG